MTVDPKRYCFLKLGFTFAGGVPVYERYLERMDQSAYDTMRLNCYPSQNSDFVTPSARANPKWRPTRASMNDVLPDLPRFIPE